MIPIRFGTDGWRAIIAKDYTVDNVVRVAQASAEFLNEKFDSPSVVIGYDCRFGGIMFSKVTALVMVKNKIQVIFGDRIASTPMVSLGVVENKSSAGIVITASHNPPTYNGYKLKGHFGGPMEPNDIQDVEARIQDETYDVDIHQFEKEVSAGNIAMQNLEENYIDTVKNKFKLGDMQESASQAVYDAMYGAGQRVLRQILPSSKTIHGTLNPSFEGVAPEPIGRNLGVLSKMLAENDQYQIGIATDGDADRIGFMNAKGEFIDSHRILLLLVYYLAGVQKKTGSVVVTFSVTDKVKQLCEHYNLPIEITKIGFKYISRKMITQNVLVGGEESGGIAVAGHIPERDGIWIALVILELLAAKQKTIDEILEEVYAIVGRFEYDRDDHHLTQAKKEEVLQRCENNDIQQFDQFKFTNRETLDGYKYYFDNGGWIMIRPSGTEPVIRIYAQGETHQDVRDLLDAAKVELSL